jgi:HEAT repeat protein
VIVPPRLRIPESLQLAAEINNQLLNLIRNRLSEKLDPIQAQDPVVAELNSMETPGGFALKVRYSELSYLVIEGLGGTRDLLVRIELEKMAQENPNPLVRASALITLAYSKDDRTIGLIQDALTHPNAIVRFGAMEAIEVGRFTDAVPSLLSIANMDVSPALRVYAMQVMARFGNPSGRYMLMAATGDQDWPARAMAFWYLGRFGSPDDYNLVLNKLPMETNPFVQAEICLGILRLAPLEQ